MIEFKGNSILLNGDVITKFNEDIKDIQFSLSGSDAVYGLKSYEKPTKTISDLAASVYKDLNTEDMQLKLKNRRALEENISYYPNPVENGIINIVSSQPLKEVIIYNISGDIVLRQEGDHTIIRTNNELVPGLYFIRSYFAKSGNYSAKKIIIL